jgi:hypothetical protein
MSKSVLETERMVDGSIEIPESDQREYEDESIEELDAALQSAIEAAEEADEDSLANMLRLQLGSLYYESSLDQ